MNDEKMMTPEEYISRRENRRSAYQREIERLEIAPEDIPDHITSVYNDPVDRVREEVWKATVKKMQFIIGDLHECESPIEKLLLLHIKLLMDRQNLFPKEFWFYAYPQHPVEINGRKYRADIVLSTIQRYPQDIDLVVECDGHDFHEKTKEQAARDKERDRDFFQAGYNVIRFTGSEIWKDPEKCAYEAIYSLWTRHKQQD